MLNMTFWQFRYSWRKWLGSLVVFFSAGLILGGSFIGINSTILEHLNHGTYNPLVIFVSPIIFGGITVMLIINGVTRLLINSFSKDYELWAILGANPKQLAFLISGQMTITSMIGAIFGYYLSFPLVINLYSWMRMTPGMEELPEVKMHLSVQSFLATILLVGVICGIMSFFDARKIFVGKQSFAHGLKKVTKFGVTPVAIILSTLSTICLIALYSVFFITPNTTRIMFGGENSSLENAYTQAFLAVTFVAIIAFSLSASIILPLVLTTIFKLFPHNHLKTANVAYWNVHSNSDFLKSVVVPLFIFSILSSFFSYLAVDLANVSASKSLSEIVGTLAIFLGAPFLVIFANIISIAIISSTQRSESIQ
ncbi:FtsX-like permease family protein [Dellaglioa sp. BT-FLS60]